MRLIPDDKSTRMLRMWAQRGSLLGGLMVLVACSTTDDRSDPSSVDSGADPATPADASSTRDSAAPREMCSSNEECVDAHDCTIDACAVGNVCEHTPIHGACATGELCSVAAGCQAGCIEDSDCDDGDYCNGVEWCLGDYCVGGLAIDCNDGNSCTSDRCDEARDGCSYETTCDAGMPDGGGTPPFDATMHYSGTFVVAPSPSLGCSTASYSFSAITITTSGGSLQVQAGTLLLAADSVPTGPTFTVSAVRGGCASYEMIGTFDDADQFHAVFTATMDPASLCAFCGDQTHTLTGVRE